MTNMEKWADTLDALHDVKVPAFNPNYDEIRARKMNLQALFMHKIKEKLVKLDDNDINGASGICNDIEDICHVYSCAMNNMYGYSIDDNAEIHHKTEKGEKLIKKVFN